MNLNILLYYHDSKYITCCVICVYEGGIAEESCAFVGETPAPEDEPEPTPPTCRFVRTAVEKLGKLPVKNDFGPF